MRVNSQPQVIADPLRDAGGQVLLTIRTNRIQDGDCKHRRACELQYRHLVCSGKLVNDLHCRCMTGVGAKHVIQHDLQGPRLQQVGGAFSGDRNKTQRKSADVRLQETADTQLFGLRRAWDTRRRRMCGVDTHVLGIRWTCMARSCQSRVSKNAPT